MRIVTSCYVLIAIILCACAQEKNSLQDMNFDECSKFVRKIVFNTIPTIEKKYDIRLIGYGGSEREGRVGWEDLAFESSEQLNMILGREIIVESTELLLQALRERDASHCFQKDQIDQEVLEISITGANFDRENNKSFIKCVSKINKNILYYDWSDTGGAFKKIHKESYEEALKIVRGEKE